MLGWCLLLWKVLRLCCKKVVIASEFRITCSHSTSDAWLLLDKISRLSQCVFQGLGPKMKAEAGYGINRAKTNRVCSYAMQKSVPLKCKLKTAANQTISVHVFSSLLDALLLWKIVMMYEASQPPSPKIGQSVCDWGIVIIHKPESQAVVRILDGAQCRVMTTV